MSRRGTLVRASTGIIRILNSLLISDAAVANKKQHLRSEF